MSLLRHEPDEHGYAAPVGMLTTDTVEEQANWLVHYYQSLCDAQGHVSWSLGLYMAKQWLRYLHEAEPDVEELRLFCQALESQRQSQGSGWTDLFDRVRRWIRTIDPREDN